MAEVIILGAGIVGLATARELALAGHQVRVLEKENKIALHQTGRNSGVIHSGLYYTPGSQKALMGVAGQKSMVAFAQERGIAHEVTGKLVVAVNSSELPQLNKIAARAEANNVPITHLTATEAREFEPHVSCVAALRVPSTGIIDYTGVCEEFVKDIEGSGGEVILGAEILKGYVNRGKVKVITSREELEADFVINCTGLYSDKIAKSFGVDPGVQIVPFRGEYFELTPEVQHLVKGLIYPVPDPRFPFLGVHLTKMVTGGVHAGPNAVLALAREGYNWGVINPKELFESLAWPGFQKLALRNLIPGAQEFKRSLLKASFAKSLAKLTPGIESKHLITAPAGVRAQALKRDGSLVDDFFIKEGERQLHVLNSPSPAATASIEIGKNLASRAIQSLERL